MSCRTSNITQRAHAQVELAPFFKLVQAASCFIGNAELMVVYIADIDDHDFYLLTIMPGGGEQMVLSVLRPTYRYCVTRAVE